MDPGRSRHTSPTIWATSIVATGLAMECHEWAHVIAGRLAGGTPTLITTTETKGEFSSLSPSGFVALGGSGFVANLVLAALGWWILQRKPEGEGTQLFGWFTFAVNGTIIATGTFGEPAAAFGDWMTILRPFPGIQYSRIAVTLLGLLGIVLMVRWAGAALGRLLVPAGDHRQRRRAAFRIMLHGAAAATLLSLGGSLASPLGSARSTLLALGASLGPFLVLTAALRHVARVPSVKAVPPPEPASRLWYPGAAAVAAFMWFVLGPGITLNR